MVGRVTPKAEPTVTVKAGVGYTPIAELEKGLRIDENALDEAHLQHADAFYRVSKQLAYLVSQRDAAKQAVEDEEAEADQRIRLDAVSVEDPKAKITAVEIAALIRLEPSVKKARNRYLSLNGSVNELSALKEAFQQRSYMLSGLTSLYSANYFGPRRDGGDEERRKAYREQSGAKR